MGCTGSLTAAFGSFFSRRCRAMNRFTIGSLMGVA
jgi:hypothetical protein